MLIQLRDGIPVNHPVEESNFRALYPSTSFPYPLTPADLEGYDFGLYEFSQQPEHGRYEKVVETQPKLSPVGIWLQQWDLVAMTTEERTETDEAKSYAVRAERNARLAACDWTQLPDAPVDAVVWATYRQELRDISSQAGFPWDVQWPAEPM